MPQYLDEPEINRDAINLFELVFGAKEAGKTRYALARAEQIRKAGIPVIFHSPVPVPRVSGIYDFQTLETVDRAKEESVIRRLFREIEADQDNEFTYAVDIDPWLLVQAIVDQARKCLKKGHVPMPIVLIFDEGSAIDALLKKTVTGDVSAWKQLLYKQRHYNFGIILMIQSVHANAQWLVEQATRYTVFCLRNRYALDGLAVQGFGNYQFEDGSTLLDRISELDRFEHIRVIANPKIALLRPLPTHGASAPRP